MRSGPHEPAPPAGRRDRPAGRCQYIDVERTATTPERFLGALTAASPFVDAGPAPRADLARARRSTRSLAFFTGARRADERAGHVPARRGARVPHVRELPGPAPRAARTAGGPRGVAQPLRADVALRRRAPSARWPAPRRSSPSCRCRRCPPTELSQMLADAVGAGAPPAPGDAATGVDGARSAGRAPSPTAGRPTRAPSPTRWPRARPAPRPGPDGRARGAARAAARACGRCARSATSCACTARAATARSRRSSRSSRRRSR